MNRMLHFALDIQHILGISFDSESGLAIEFDNCPEIVVELQEQIKQHILDKDLLSNPDESLLCIAFDEILLNLIRQMKQSGIFVDSDLSNPLNKLFGDNIFKGCRNSTTSLLLHYFIRVRENYLMVHKRQLIEQNTDENEKFLRIFELFYKRVKACLILFLRGLTHSSTVYNDISNNLTRFLLLNQSQYHEFIFDLISFACDDSNSTFKQAFEPVIHKLRTCIMLIRLNHTDSDSIYVAEQIFRTLNYLLSIKYSDTRPFAELICSRPDFSPGKNDQQVFQKLTGLIYFKSSYLGPFVGLTLAQLQSNDLSFDDAEFAFDNAEMADYEKTNYFNAYHTQLSSLRVELHSMFKAFLTCANTRESILEYIAAVISKNRKLAQLQADHDKLAGSSPLLQLASVLFDLSSKVSIDKVQNDYNFHKMSRLAIKEDTLINMSSLETDEYIGQREVDLSYTPSFNTECFYLTIDVICISINPIISSLKELKRYAPFAQKRIKDLENEIKELNDLVSQRAKETLDRAKRAYKRIMLSICCYECLVSDPNILTKCSNFCSAFLSYMIRSIIPNRYVDGQPTADFPQRFFAFPERYLEAILDFFRFVFRKERSVKLDLVDLPHQLALLASNLNYVKNPFLGAKIVEILFMLTPPFNPQLTTLFHRIITDQIALTNLFPSLVKFYANVETTGASSEFYDKFNIRRNIQVVFKFMWIDAPMRDAMMHYAMALSRDFIRFINMVINDTTFLLDESMVLLKQIHEIEALMNNTAEWNRLSKEEKDQKNEALTGAKSNVAIWLQLGNETIDLFVDLTKDAAKVFLQEELRERVASMLNYNLVKLIGPKCSELKVRDAGSRFHWNPRNLTGQIIQIYINLYGDELAEAMVEDERSYTPDTFALIIENLRSKNIVPTNMIELFKNQCERTERYWQEKVQCEEEFGDEIPDEFRDALMMTLMRDPVRLPSGQVVDRKNILRHLLSDATNPFTRQPLAEAELVSELELKTKINDWIKEIRMRR